jgi:hypothetical protein
MIDLLPDAPDPANDIPSEFNRKAAALVLAQKAMVPQLNSAIGNLNSIAAGGAYSIPFTFSTSGAGNGGKLTWPGYSGSIYFDTTDSRGVNVTSLLGALLTSSSSAIKGSLRICKMTDPGSWILLDITGYTQFALYGTATTIFVGSVGSIVPGDPIMVFLQRTGDKGDTGPMSTFPTLIVRDQQASGVAGLALSSGAWSTRRFNTANINTISGASLGTAGANKITLPAGTYIGDISAEAVATQAGLFKHQIRLYNQTDAGLTDAGTSEYQNINATNSHFIGTRSVMHTYFAITGPKDFTIDHYSSLTASGGYATSAPGSAEIYAEARFIKVA